METLELLKLAMQYGLPTVLLIAGGIVFVKKVLPVFLKAFESNQVALQDQLQKTEEARRREQGEFMDNQKAFLSALQEIERQHATSVAAVATEVRTMAAEVRAVSRRLPARTTGSKAGREQS